MERTRRRTVGRRIALSLAVTTVVLAGCGSQVAGVARPFHGPGTQEASSGDPTPDTPPVPAGDVPAGLAEFYGQTITWGPCADYVTGSDNQDLYTSAPGLECADLQVPLSYADPSGPSVVMAILRARATGAEPIGSLLFNPGGPGASGMMIAAQFAAYDLGGDLRSRFDYVGFDTRGTGSSRPVVSCTTDAEKDEDRANNPSTATDADIAAAEARTKAKALACAERTGAQEGVDGAAFLASVGSVDVVKDMDVLRAALGDDKLTYIGYSYGTLLGTLYAEAFPQNVRAMILDGAVDNSQSQEESLLGQAAGFQSAFEDFAADCATVATCVLGDDPAQATAVFQSLAQPLVATPAPVDDGRVLSFNDAITGVIQAMYSQTLWPALQSALLDLSKGDGTALMELADSYESRDSDGRYSTLMDAFTAIHCVDDERMTDPELARALSAKYTAAAPFSDNGEPPAPNLDVCAYWPAPVTLTQHTPNAPGIPKIVIVSTTGDPATPYQAGVDLAADLGASLITVEGTQHTGFLSLGNTCLDDAGVNYLIDLVDPPADLTC